ncbi:restriction endonuclease [Paenibacillus sp. S150]|uniref:restriction endonuclease n=1 Tax=Paenibacillus sp. S150 TaxID=2749826 RepID=UPI001C598E29|nr:restriction endonuclease [Paenibacillus sp. S150]MBW4079963.1 hypothetical protein [Paenibacillus sp. S150]
MQPITENEMTVELSLCGKPKAYNSEDGYPFEKLDDRQFEIIVYYIFKEEIQNSPLYKTRHNRITLMPGVGEKGRDCTLQLNNKYTGIIQCKRFGDRVDKPQVAKEIIKFSLHYHLDNTLITDIDQFTYYFATSIDFTGPAIQLLDNFASEIEHEAKLDRWITDVISDYESFKELELETIKPRLIEILKSLKIEKVTSTDLNVFIDKYNYIVEKFFSINKVVSISEVEALIKSKDLSFAQFLMVLFEEIKSIDGIRSINIKEQLIHRVELILTQIKNLGEENFKKVICNIKVPFLTLFQDPQEIKFIDNKELIKNIVINLSLISFIYPEIKLIDNKGQSINLDGNTNLAYLHTAERSEYNVVILRLLRYFNEPDVDISRVEKVIIGNVAADNCFRENRSALIDFDHIITQITEVDLETAEGKEEFNNLKTKYDFIYHCEHAFNFQTKNTIEELIDQLNKVLGGDRVGSI